MSSSSTNYSRVSPENITWYSIASIILDLMFCLVVMTVGLTQICVYGMERPTEFWWNTLLRLNKWVPRIVINITRSMCPRTRRHCNYSMKVTWLYDKWGKDESLSREWKPFCLWSRQKGRSSTLGSLCRWQRIVVAGVGGIIKCI